MREGIKDRKSKNTSWVYTLKIPLLKEWIKIINFQLTKCAFCQSFYHGSLGVFIYLRRNFLG